MGIRNIDSPSKEPLGESCPECGSTDTYWKPREGSRYAAAGCNSCGWGWAVDREGI